MLLKEPFADLLDHLDLGSKYDFLFYVVKHYIILVPIPIHLLHACLCDTY